VHTDEEEDLMPAVAKEIREHNGAEAGRRAAESARQAAETAQETVRVTFETASQALQRTTDEIVRSLGFTGPHTEELTQQSSRNVEAIARCSSVLARGLTEISREWLNLAQHRMQTNLSGLEALGRCRTLQDLITAQSQLMRDNMQEIISNSRRIAELSVQVTSEAAQTISDATRSATQHGRRAAA
jgi:hypothetical protein